MTLRTRRVRRAVGRTAAGLTVLTIGVLGLAPLGGATPANSRWVVSPSQNLHNALLSDELVSVSCIRAADCFAVGYAGNPGVAPVTPGEPLPAGIEPLVEHFDGSNWTLVATPTVAGALASVSCVPNGTCVAVGGTQSASGAGATLIEHFDGAGWSVVPSPNGAAFGENMNELDSVSCSAADRCVAVGSDLDMSNPLRTTIQDQLIEQLTTSGWALMQGAPGWEGALGSVSCYRAGCVAIGRDAVGGQIAEQLVGAAWRQIGYPTNGALEGVACSGQRIECFSVGSNFHTPFSKATSSRFSDGGWRALRSASPKAQIVELNGVTCDGSAHCVAVGASGSPMGRSPRSNRTLVERWSGSAWTTVPSADTASSGGDSLLSVSCWARNGCAAVGFSQIGENGAVLYPPNKTLALVTR